MKNQITITPDTFKRYKVIKLYNVLLETLEEVNDGLGGIPSGHAYMAYSNMLDLDQYQTLLRGLENVKAINVKNHFITQGERFKELFDAYKAIEKAFDDKLSELKGQAVCQ
jgi:hypothetical protein